MNIHAGNWKTHDGSKATVKTPISAFEWRGTVRGCSVTWLNNGRVLMSAPHPFDLVEVWQEPVLGVKQGVWLTRNGRTADVNGPNGEGGWCGRAHDGTYMGWNRDGKSHNSSAYDLISLVQDTPKQFNLRKGDTVLIEVVVDEVLNGRLTYFGRTGSSGWVDQCWVNSVLTRAPVDPKVGDEVVWGADAPGRTKGWKIEGAGEGWFVIRMESGPKYIDSGLEWLQKCPNLRIIKSA